MSFSNRKMDEVRGSTISMVFQDPMTSLNPVLTVGDQISEVIKTHQHISNAEAMEKAKEMLALVDYAVQQQPDHARLEERLQQYILGFERNRSVQRQAKIDRSREHTLRLIAALAKDGSAEQKRHLVARAQSLIDDFSVLVAQR